MALSYEFGETLVRPIFGLRVLGRLTQGEAELARRIVRSLQTHDEVLILAQLTDVTNLAQPLDEIVRPVLEQVHRARVAVVCSPGGARELEGLLASSEPDRHRCQVFNELPVARSWLVEPQSGLR